MVDAGTLLLVGRDGLSLSQDTQHLDARLYSVRQFPQAWAGWGMGELTGDLLSNTLRLPCPFLYTLTVHVPDQIIAAHGARLKAARATQMAGSPKTGSITMAVPLNDRFTLIEICFSNPQKSQRHPAEL